MYRASKYIKDNEQYIEDIIKTEFKKIDDHLKNIETAVKNDLKIHKTELMTQLTQLKILDNVVKDVIIKNNIIIEKVKISLDEFNTLKEDIKMFLEKKN